MTSLAEAYERRSGEVSRRRVVLGTGLFVVGALLSVVGIVTGATTVLIDAGLVDHWWEAREVGGVLAGLGVPAVFVGIFTVLPASRTSRAAAAIGAAIAVLGVVLFEAAYPLQWYVTDGIPTALALWSVGTYFFGTITTFWCLFASVATFKRRADPGGTVTLEFTRGGETRTVEVAADDAPAAREALGGVGVFGSVDDPDRGQRVGASGSGAASDGGAAASDLSSPMDDGHVIQEEEPDPVGDVTDRYCGNCAAFQYVRTDEGIRPYCRHHDERMDDMDACSEWRPNS